MKAAAKELAPVRVSEAFARVAFSATAISGVALCAWVLWCCRRGYDFSDEGSYLESIANPAHYSISATQYGFVYHPLFRLLRGDIAMLRQANVVISLLLATVLFYLSFRSSAHSDDSPEIGWQPRPLPLALVFSTSCLVFLDVWLPTPNYHSLALQALLLGTCGLLLVSWKLTARCVVGWVLLGLSGWVEFLAKPTSAAGFALLSVVCLISARKCRIRHFIIPIAVVIVLGLVTGRTIDGSVGAFLNRLARGAHDVQILHGNLGIQRIIRWDHIEFTGAEKLAFLAESIAAFALTLLSLSGRVAAQLAVSLILIVLAGWCLCVEGGVFIPNLSEHPYQCLQFLAVPIGAIPATIVSRWRRFEPTTTWKVVPFALGLALVPFADVFGSDRNYWQSAAENPVFWSLSATAIIGLGLGVDFRRRLVPIAAMMQFGTVLVISLSTEKPYRLTHPLREASTSVQFGANGSKLLVSPDFADYILAVQHAAFEAGFQKGGAIIDLSGHYPGTLYALGAESVGRPWLIGGYAGSEDLAITALDRVPCAELTSAWILDESSGPCRLNPGLLNRYGIDLVEDYAVVATIPSPTGNYPNSFEQRILRPIRDPETAQAAYNRLQSRRLHATQ